MNDKMKLRIAFLLLILPVVLASCSLHPRPESSASVDITILHVYDMHGHIMPYLNKSVNRTVSVGDADRSAVMIRHERNRIPTAQYFCHGRKHVSENPGHNESL